ncbi:MAG: hypothetical protein KDA05_10555, partial [Phycisphaerales bacterium]|nr:hypothetical protein [Phycisphaerales bacterium]
PGEGERLRAVHGEGGVYVRSGTKEITADTINYDADTGVLTAVSPTSGTVRVLDGVNAWSAAAIRWDMVADRIEIISPGDVVSPR